MGEESPQPRQVVIMHDPRVFDPDEELVRRSHLSDAELGEVMRVLDAMRRWREAERAMSEASQRYMKLGETDMRALRFLIAAHRQGVVATPSQIAAHLGVTTASMTKLLDRLAEGGHIRRMPHPSDRRSIAIEVTDDTRLAARATVGRSHARRFDVIAELDSPARETVARFFESLIATADLADAEEGDAAGHP